MSSMLNFNSMPEEAAKRSVTIGQNHLVIKEATVEKTAAGKKALIVVNNVKGHDKPNIKDWYVCFNAQGEPENFGQYKLKRLLEAIGVIPEGNFTLEVLPTLIKEKEYIGVLKYQDEEEKYLEIAHPDAEGNFQPLAEQVDQTAVPVETKKEEEVSPEVKQELSKDDIL